MTIFVSRAEWGHHGPRGGREMSGKVPYEVCHHTPDQEPTTYDEAVEELHQILAGHLAQDWGDIGYTFVVWGDYVFEGRGFGRTGAHAPGANSQSIGIAFLLDGRDRAPSEMEWRSAAWIMRRGVDEGYAHPDFVTTGHQDWVATACPATMVYGNMANLRIAYEGGTPTEENDLLPEEREWLRHAYEMSKALPAINHNAHYAYYGILDMFTADPAHGGPAQWFLSLLHGINHKVAMIETALAQLGVNMDEVRQEVDQAEELAQASLDEVRKVARSDALPNPTEPVGLPVGPDV